jgi:hypothetical protein
MRAASGTRPIDEDPLLGLAFDEFDGLLALDRLAPKQNVSQVIKLVAVVLEQPGAASYESAMIERISSSIWLAAAAE